MSAADAGSGDPDSARPHEHAATLLLLRDGGDGLEVFMIQRPTASRSFAGALVFPGGKVDAADRDPVVRALCEGAAGLDDDALTYRVAAVREGFEECGVLLARRAGQSAFVAPVTLDRPAGEWQRDLAEDVCTIADLCRGEGLRLAIDALVPFAHWITPKIVPRIYDTHFFLAAAPAGQEARHDGKEGTDSIWVAPEAAIAESDAGIRTVVFPTRLNLSKIGRAGTVAEALARAATTPVVTVQPVAKKHPEGRLLTIPAEAGYGVTQALVGQNGSNVRIVA